MAYKRKDSGGSVREAFGNYAVNSQYTHRVYNPRSETKGKITEIRIIPAVDQNDGSFSPQIVPVDGLPIEGIGETFHAAEFVSFLGDKKYQFVTNTSDFPEKESPTRMFYNKIEQFLKDEGEKNYPKWAEWTKFGGGVQLPSWVMMVQAALIKLNGEVMKDKQGNPAQIAPIIMVMNRSATIDFEKKLTEVVDSSKDISADNSLIGDVTSPKDGKTVVIDSFLNAEGRKRYEVAAGQKMPLDEQFIKSTFVPWDKLLRVETAAWQINRLVETFDAASVDMVFASDPEYGQFLPANVRGAFKGAGNSTTVSMAPNYAPPTSATPPPAQPSTPQPTPGTAQQPAPPVAEVTGEAPTLNIVSPAGDNDQSSTAAAPAGLADNPIMQSLMAEKNAAQQ
jgi:hypothetical protein